MILLPDQNLVGGFFWTFLRKCNLRLLQNSEGGSNRVTSRVDKLFLALTPTLSQRGEGAHLEPLYGPLSLWERDTG